MHEREHAFTTANSSVEHDDDRAASPDRRSSTLTAPIQPVQSGIISQLDAANAPTLILETNWNAEARATGRLEPTRMLGPWHDTPVPKHEIDLDDSVMSDSWFAFNGVWRNAMSTWNHLQPEVQSYVDAVKNNAADSVFGSDLPAKGDLHDLADKTTIKGTRNKLGESFTPDGSIDVGGAKVFDNARVPFEERSQIVELVVEMNAKEAALKNAPGNLRIEANAYKNCIATAHNALISIEEHMLSGEGDVLEMQKKSLARAKELSVGLTNSITTSVKGFFVEMADPDPTKGVGDVIGGFGKMAETLVGAHIDTFINDVELKILDVQSKITQLRIEKERNNAANCFRDAQNAIQRLRNVADAIKSSIIEYRRIMKTLAEKVSAGSRVSAGPKGADHVYTAIKALPVIENIKTAISDLYSRLVPPTYTSASGRGATLAENYHFFADHLSTMWGVRTHLGDKALIWSLRADSVRKLLNSVG